MKKEGKYGKILLLLFLIYFKKGKKKKKVYDVLLVIFIIAAIIVGTLIVIKYGKNRINENEIAASLEELNQKFANLSGGNQEETIDQYYKDYHIEGIIEIPKIEIKYPILETTNDDSMKISITKFFGPNVNDIGNFTMAGHNNRDGTMFGKTKRLEIGDIIKMTDLKNHTVDYEIFKIYSTDPNDVSIVESVKEGTREITLITCTNGHRNRLITKAREIIK